MFRRRPQPGRAVSPARQHGENGPAAVLPACPDARTRSLFLTSSGLAGPPARGPGGPRAVGGKRVVRAAADGDAVLVDGGARALAVSSPSPRIRCAGLQGHGGGQGVHVTRRRWCRLEAGRAVAGLSEATSACRVRGPSGGRFGRERGAPGVVELASPAAASASTILRGRRRVGKEMSVEAARPLSNASPAGSEPVRFSSGSSLRCAPPCAPGRGRRGFLTLAAPCGAAMPNSATAKRRPLPPGCAPATHCRSPVFTATNAGRDAASAPASAASFTLDEGLDADRRQQPDLAAELLPAPAAGLHDARRLSLQEVQCLRAAEGPAERDGGAVKRETPLCQEC